MKKAVKELIAEAVPLESTEFSELWIIDSEKIYRGFWGKNGYNNIIILGRGYKKDQIELISNSSDAIHFMNDARLSLNIDIKSTNGIVHIWFHRAVRLQGEPMSSVIFE